MPRKLAVAAVFAAFAVTGILMPLRVHTSSKTSVDWYGFDQGMRLGKYRNKKVVINFYADWCGFCDQMDTQTFGNRRVARYMNEHFISVKVDSDKEKGLAGRYDVKGLPSTWFVTPEGEKISNLPGFVQPDVFADILEFVHTDSYKTMSFKRFRDGRP